jgi:oligo-1,6-glucosidase
MQQNYREIQDPSPAWWKEAIIYQVYPRSFKDSDGDGIGDLPGILSKLDYFAGLGIDTVWLNPVYASPDTDNGYDISDYTAIQRQYGSMADLDLLIKRLHEKNIRLIMDMVVNHTSDEHEWFRQARTSRDNPYYDFYCWWPGEKGEPPYRCGFFDDRGQGWHYNKATHSWYLHYFSPRQPDLNWDHPALRQKIYEILRSWLDKGVDGFRMDAVTFISKDPFFPPVSPELLKEKYSGDWGHYYAAGPHLHEYLREMHREVFSRYDALIIGEAPGISAQTAAAFVGGDPKELNMLCHFEGVSIGYLPGEFKKIDPAGFSLVEFKRVYSKWNDAFAETGWGALYLGNHDQPRMVSRWGNDSDVFRNASAKMLFTFLLTMRATPMIYNGDELGMTNIRFESIEEYHDIETLHMYKKIKDSGGDAEGFLKDQQMTGRDNSRTPFQWDAAFNAGFTKGRPWIKVNENHTRINVAAEEADPHSILQYVRKAIRLRKEQRTLIYGKYELLDPDNPHVYAYTRTLDAEQILVLLNFSKQEQPFPVRVEGYAVLLNNYPDGTTVLHPYQALVISVPLV